MIKYKGTTLYPSALYNVLDSINVIVDYLIEVSRNAIGTDEILIKAFSPDHNDDLAKEIKDHVKAKLRVTPSVEFVTRESLDETRSKFANRKVVRFIDKRTQD
jgi:phenylacetate-CoA ligase